MDKINDLRVTLADIERELVEGKEKNNLTIMGDVRRALWKAMGRKYEENVMDGDIGDFHMTFWYLNPTSDEDKAIRAVVKKHGFKLTTKGRHYDLYRYHGDKKGIALRVAVTEKKGKAPGYMKIFINEKY